MKREMQPPTPLSTVTSTASFISFRSTISQSIILRVSWLACFQVYLFINSTLKLIPQSPYLLLYTCQSVTLRFQTFQVLQNYQSLRQCLHFVLRTAFTAPITMTFLPFWRMQFIHLNLSFNIIFSISSACGAYMLIITNISDFHFQTCHLLLHLH